MEQRRPPEYTLEVFADPSCVKEVVKAILHTIFFHRYFIPIVPVTRDLLDQTLPAIDDVNLETLIDQRATSLVRAIEPTTASSSSSSSAPSAAAASAAAAAAAGSSAAAYQSPARASSGAGGHGHGHGHGQSGRAQIAVSFYEKKRRKGYFFGKTDEEVCWEVWTLDVTCATPRTETEAVKVRRAMEKSLHKTALKIINIVNRDKDHIPPITTTEMNPFPYQITVNPKSDSLGPRMGIF